MGDTTKLLKNTTMKNTTTKSGTFFNSNDFSWDGMYLMYEGRHNDSVNWEDTHPDCHPSRVGVNKSEFIARFKYGRKVAEKNRFIKVLCNSSITVEEYVSRLNNNWQETPLGIIESL
jgi:hypothetical protein